jgi:hypothetical protein
MVIGRSPALRRWFGCGSLYWLFNLDRGSRNFNSLADTDEKFGVGRGSL